MTGDKKIGPRIIFINVEGNVSENVIKRVTIVDDKKFRYIFKRINKATVKRLIKVFENYDIIVTWGGVDVALLTAWALRLGINPSPLHALTHLDLEKFIREKLMLTNLGLEKTAEFLRVKPQRESIDTLAKVFEKLRSFVKDVMPELAL